MAVKETIYADLLDFLHYTQTPDDSTARRIQDEAAAGLEYLKRYFDPDATYEPGTRGYALLCEYVLRAESGAVSTFETDFSSDLVGGRVENDVKAYAEAMGYAED